MNLHHKDIIITTMKLKLIVIASLLAANTVLADNLKLPAKEPAISGKPYSAKPYSGTPYSGSTLPSQTLDTSLPDLGDISQTVLTPQDEQRIAEQILREVAVSDDVLQDAEVTDYLQALGGKLAASSTQRPSSTEQGFTEHFNFNHH